MEYITHIRFRKISACNEQMNIPYSTRLRTIGNFIANGKKAVCTIYSEDAYRYFARNDDEQGLERGALTYAIAYAPRKVNRTDGKGFRFTDKEIEMLETEYPQFLKDTGDYILFNHDFFNADIEVLKEINNKLNGGRGCS